MAKANPKIAPQVPGEPVQQQPETAAPIEPTPTSAEPADAAPDESAAPVADAVAEPVEPEAQADIEAEAEAVIDAQVELGEFGEDGIALAARGRIPEPHEVDPKRIKRSVLTTQGYVTPAESAPHPAQKF